MAMGINRTNSSPPARKMLTFELNQKFSLVNSINWCVSDTKFPGEFPKWIPICRWWSCCVGLGVFAAFDVAAVVVVAFEWVFFSLSRYFVFYLCYIMWNLAHFLSIHPVTVWVCVLSEVSAFLDILIKLRITHYEQHTHTRTRGIWTIDLIKLELELINRDSNLLILRKKQQQPHKLIQIDELDCPKINGPQFGCSSVYI